MAEIKQAPPLSSNKQERMWKLDVKPKCIYVAATLAEQGRAAQFALQLIDAGFTVTSRWLRANFSARPGESDWRRFVEFEERMGRIDVEDVRKSDTLIVLAHEPSASGGYHVELGMFLGADKTNIIAVGNRPNVFYWTESVRFTPSTLGLVEWLASPEHGSNLPPSTRGVLTNPVSGGGNLMGCHCGRCDECNWARFHPDEDPAFAPTRLED